MASRGVGVARYEGTRRNLTLSWLVLFIFSILLQYGALAGARPVLGASGLKAGSVSGFEVDGDLKSGDASGNPGAIPAALIDGSLADGNDWLSGTTFTPGVVDPAVPPHSQIYADPVSSSSDDVFTQGSKELDTQTWTYTHAKPTPKDDMSHVMAYAKLVGNSGFFFMGAERIVNNGSTHLDFELNKKPFKVWGDGLAKVNRTNGDLLISLDFSNGGSNPQVTVYQFGNVVDHPNGQTADVTDITTSAAVHSATNFADLVNAGFGYTIPSFEFAEASIDLASLGIQTSCPGLSSAFIRTRSGDDPASSELKDKAPEIPIDLNDCGKLRIEKRAGTANGAPLGGATFTVAGDPTPGSNANLLTITDNGAGDSNPAAGIIDINPAKPGTYTVCETVAPTGYKLANPACQQNVVIATSGSADVVFVDPRKTATTTLAVPQGGASPADGSFVAVGQSISLTVTETNTGESVLHGIQVTGTGSCATWTAAVNKNNGAGAYSGSLNPGESVNYTCTFTAPNVSDFSWSATATGLDELNAQASSTNETAGGGYDVLQPATKLTLVQNAPAQVHATDTVTIIVNEKNDGEGTITGVHVDGTGACAGGWVADASKQGGGSFSGSLAPGESVNFTCTVVHPANDFTWSADGKGTDALSHAVPSTNEHQAGSVDVVSPSTALTLVSAPTKVHAGDTITVIVNEKNTGDGPLTNVHVVAGGDCASFSPASVTLAAGASQDFTCTITTTAGNGTDKSWTADGKGTDALGAAAPTTGEHQDGTVIVIAPATTLVAGNGNPTKVEHNSQVILTVVESNTGDDTLIAVNVTGTNSCSSWVAAGSKNNGAGLFIGSLAPGESVNFTCTIANIGTSDVHWTALGHGTDSLGAFAPATNEDEAGDIDVINPATVLTFVSSIPNPVAAHGSTTITVNEKNTGDSSLSGVDVTGSPCATWTAADAGFNGTLAAGASEDFSCTVADVGTTSVNWGALGHGIDELQNAAPATNENASGNVHVVNPNIDIVKTVGASLGNQAADGTVYETQDDSNVVYKYVVTTQDPDGLTGVSVSDDKCSPVTAEETAGHNVGDTNTDDTLQPGESWVFSCSTNLSIADDGKTVHNIGTASGQPRAGGKVSSEDGADATLLVPGISIVKTAGDAADGATYTTEAFADNVTYHYAIKNTGELDLNNITVVDDNGTPANTADDFTVCTIPSLAVGASTTCDKTLTVNHDTTNVAVATGHTGQKPNEDVSANDDAVVNVVGPAIQIIKTAGDAADGAELVVEPGTDNVTYHYAVTNTGEVDLLGVHVVDDAGTPADTSDDIDVCTIGSLKIGQTANCSVTLTVLLSTTNIAIATGHTAQQPNKDVTDNDDAVVRIPDLTIAKSYTGNTGGSASDGTGIAKVGDTLTYTLAYDLSDGPVTNGVITDVLPDGLDYVAGSATNSDEFTFVSYTSATRTLRWTASTVTKDGSVSYKVKVLDGSFNLPQPLENVATIDSDQTPSKSDHKDVLVQVVAAVTETPKVTLPPTDTLNGDQAPSNPGSGLMLTLLVLAGIGLLAGHLAPTPGRPRRERPRRP